MNKQCFRVIFSKTLQRLVVVSELAKSEGKSTERNDFSISHVVAQLKPLTFSLFCALGFVAFSDSALAETLIIQADKSAPKNQQPIVLQTANGLPQVNIQTPNDKGLSHNKYSQFDVAEKGAILNNSRTNTQTQQAGLIQGNPYLARGEAKVILNEVNSNKLSVMKGYVEVAGKKANVIIANPSGLYCEGCGIINSDRATFTTGKPEIKNGQVDNFKVEVGKVKVSGKGLDNSRVDYTEIIARETEMNAGIWSKKETKVITGKNTVKRSENDKNLQIINTKQPLAEEAKPQFAIDVGELGGMYSGKIHLIGTENGVGVRNAGHIGASADTLQIDSQGRIVNTSTLNAAKSVTLTASNGIENKGKIENKQGDIKLNSTADIKQDGSIVARHGNIHKTASSQITQNGESVAKGSITYQAPKVRASTQSLIAAGVEVKDTAQGEVRSLETNSAQGKDITVLSTTKATLQGKNLASGKINVQGSEIDLDNSHTSAYDVNVTAHQGHIQANSATLIADKTLSLSTPTELQTQQSYLKADKITAKQRSLTTHNAVWEQTGTDELKISVNDQLKNQGGTFKTQGNLSIHSQGIDNRQGRLLANGKLIVNAGTSYINTTNGAMLSNQNLLINSGELINDNGLIQSNQNVVINTQKQTLSNKQTLTDTQDKGIVALGKMNIQSANITNQQGRIVSVGNQTLNVTNIDNQRGLIYSQENLALNAKNLTNDQGSIRSAKQADMTLSDNFNQQNGSLQAQGLNLTANSLSSINHSVVFAEYLNITTSAELSNKDSQIISKFDGNITTGGKLDNTSGTIGSQQGSLKVDTNNHTLETEKGNIVAAQHINLNSGMIENNQGLILANEITINSNNQSINNQDTLLENQSDRGIIAQNLLALNTGSLNNNNGNILSRKNSTVNTTSLVNNQGKIRTQSQLNLNTNILSQNAGLITANILNLVADSIKSNKQSEISGNQVNVTTQALNNQGSKLIAQHSAHVGVKQGIQNQNGVLASLGERLTINSHQSDLNNVKGLISAQNGTLNLDANTLNNQHGSIRAKTAGVTTLQILDNRNTLSDKYQGIVVTDLTLNAKQLDNLTIKAANIESQGSLKEKADKALSITTLNVSNKEHYNGNADNYYRLDQQAEIGSILRGKDGVRLVGMENATLRQATVSSENGETFVGSKGDVRIESGEQSEQLASSSKGSTKGWFSKTTETHRHYHDTTENIGSEIDGNKVTLYSETGKVDIHGSAVVADKQLLIDGKAGVNITSATNTHYAENEHIKTKSGLMGTGSIGFSVGKKKEQIEQDQTQQSAARSQVGSLSGDTIIRTDGHYQQTGSIVTSRDGDVDITAKSANITAARSDYESNYKRTYEQKGVTIAVNIPVVQAIQSVDSAVKSAKSVGGSKNDRINALGAANAGFQAWRTAEQVGKLAEAMGKNPTEALSQDVSVSITYGEQKSVETQHSEGNKSEKSQINAGGKLNIKTKGGGKESTLTIVGSDVSGKGGTHLKAEGDVNILAVDENHLERSKNKSSGFNAGVAIGHGSSGFAFGVTAGGNVAKGYGNGESRAWVGSQVGSLDSRTTIESGGDTNIVGSQAKGKSVKVNAENLNIQSLQDTMKYEGKQESASAQVTVGYGASGSTGYSKSKMKADMATVNQQAGIFAGDDGYDVDVKQHTELTGGLVTSTEKAEMEGKNSFATGTLNTTNLDNHADYKGSAMSANVAGDYKDGWNGQRVDKEGNPAHSLSNVMGYGSDKDNQSSQTISGINSQNLIIRNEQAQLEKTGKTAEQIREEVKTNTTTDNAESRSGKLENRFDKDKLQKELDYQVKAITDFQAITIATINEKVASHYHSNHQ